jgi:membrane protease YdiL (CAAX protease family)
VALILSLPFVAMQFTAEVVWSAADFTLVGLLLAVIGIALELAARKTGNLAVAIAVAVLGVAAAIVGKADDAPGLVLLGCMLVGGGLAIGLRQQRTRLPVGKRSRAP